MYPVIELSCRVVLAGLLLFSFFSCLKGDINGRPAKAPEGFSGAVGTVLSTAITAALLYGAGAFR